MQSMFFVPICFEPFSDSVVTDTILAARCESRTTSMFRFKWIVKKLKGGVGAIINCQGSPTRFIPRVPETIILADLKVSPRMGEDVGFVEIFDSGRNKGF